MNHESAEETSFVHDFIKIAGEERRRLEVGQSRLEGMAALTQRARLTLESRARACLKTNTNLGSAVEMLALSGALEKADVQVLLKDQLDRLEKSNAEEDQGALMDMCRKLVSLTADRALPTAKSEL